MSELEQFANTVETIRAGRNRVIWPKSIRAEALRLIKSGVDTADLQQATRISENTFKEWLSKSVPKKNIIELAVKPAPADLLVMIEGRDVTIHVQNLSAQALAEICSKVL